MRKITLAKAWSYVTPTKTVDYPAGEHEVSNEIAAAAEADGAIPQEQANDGSDKPSASRAKSAADAS